MAQKVDRVSIGFSGGQVVEVRLPEGKLGDLRKAVEGEGWADIETIDGTVSLNLAQIVFLRSAATQQSIGFGG